MIVTVSTDTMSARGGPRLLIWYMVDEDEIERQMIWTSLAPLAWRHWSETVTKPSTARPLSLPSDP